MKHWIKFSAAAMLAAALTGCGTTEKTASAEAARTTTMNGVNCYYGNGEEVDLAQAMCFLNSAARAGDPAALFFVGESYRRGLDERAVNGPKAEAAYRQSFQALTREFRETGDPLAAFLLGEMLADGRGGEYDPAAAFALYGFAADKDFAPARVRLGTALASGLASGETTAEAQLLKAAESNAAEADMELYKLYVAQGKTEAAAGHLKKALRRNVPEAMFLDALAAEAAPKRAEDAPDLYRQAAKAGSPQAARVVAERYTVAPTEKLAKLRAAAGGNDVKALLALAQGYLDQPQSNFVMAQTAAYFAHKLDPQNAEAAKLTAEINRKTGLLPIVAAVWNNRIHNAGDLMRAEFDLDPVLMAYRAGSEKGSQRELNYLLDEGCAEAFYLSGSFYQFNEYCLPLKWLKEVFAKLDRKQDALGMAMQYAVSAGLAGNGELQSQGADALLKLLKAGAGRPVPPVSSVRRTLAEAVPALAALPKQAVDLREYEQWKSVWLDIANLLKANGLLLMNRKKEAYEFLGKNQVVNNKNETLIAFINRFCNPLLVDKAEFSRVTGIAPKALGTYSRPVYQEFFSFR